MKYQIGKGLIATVMLSVSSFSALAEQYTPGVNIADVEQAVTEAMERFHIPGIALAVVERGEVVLSKGYGLRHIAHQDKVDADTLFGIASNSKAFTAAALAVLVDEGKLSWSDEVIKHIPEFRLSDPYVTRAMTIADLLSHRSGLGKGAGDLMIWPDTDKTMADLLEGIAHLPIESSLRSTYAYNNLMFVVAGEVVNRVSGMGWRDFVEQRLFKPMGMDTSRAGFSRIPQENQNWATGSIFWQGQLTPFFVDYLEDFRGAGAIASSANDMSLWLKTQLAAGKMPNGNALFSEVQQVYMWHPYIMRWPNEAGKAYQRQFRGYGLGWAIEDYFGHKKVWHGGGIPGMVSQVAMIPGKQLGVVVLSNQQAFPALTAIINEVFEDALGLPDKEWVKEAAEKYQLKREEAYRSAGAVKLDKRQPQLANQVYTGTLVSPWYGNVIVEELNGELYIDFTHTEMLKGKLQHHTGNTFIVKWQHAELEADAYIDFTLSPSQQVEAASMSWVNPDITDFSFDFHNLQLKAKPLSTQ
ncbi:MULTISPECIES: serine hydrolase [Pseudoalteromonas]|uniref:serine hydrolase n=1 Tax=Pseudoalteromonas TaxID=53246 RepID=UPI001EF481A0|nr:MULTISPECIES: serine hydrolase [Pseudoalteromonas]MCG7561930.1 serine hydrolase [Pseudoalteromonas sp. McH1-42]MEC4088466.1 serine hydrolase [Pseudoalteromonas rubra]